MPSVRFYVFSACAACVRLAGSLAADTVSNTVGVLRVTAAQDVTVAVARPFGGDQGVFDEDGLAQQLAGDGANSDRLHVWTGRHFNSYALSGGAWRILGTTTDVPAERLSGAAGAGFMVTRKASGQTEVLVFGDRPEDAVIDVTVPAASWALIGHPYPADMLLGTLTAAGAGNGDQVKIWDETNQEWSAHVKGTEGWSGAGGDSAVIAAGRSFLFYNASTESRSLSFQRPY